MKNRWLLALVIMLVLIVLGLLVFALISKQQSSSQTVSSVSNPFAATVSNQSISDFTVGCYKAYLQTFAEQQSTISKQYEQEAQSCFTVDFIKQWPSIISSTEGDPVLLAQDYYNSWLGTISASTASQTSSDAEVIVNLGTGSENRQLLAHLQFTSSGWRISSVTSP